MPPLERAAWRNEPPEAWDRAAAALRESTDNSPLPPRDRHDFPPGTRVRLRRRSGNRSAPTVPLYLDQVLAVVVAVFNTMANVQTCCDRPEIRYVRLVELDKVEA